MSVKTSDAADDTVVGADGSAPTSAPDPPYDSWLFPYGLPPVADVPPPVPDPAPPVVVLDDIIVVVSPLD
eukprot:11812585-Ditylum_brightwellii.AAC.1